MIKLKQRLIRSIQSSGTLEGGILIYFHRQALIMEIEETIPRLKIGAKQSQKDVVITETLKLLKQLQNSRSALFQKGIEAPTVAELERYGISSLNFRSNCYIEKEIKNKFSLKGEYGVDVVLEGKKDSSKKTTCCTMF